MVTALLYPVVVHLFSIEVAAVIVSHYFSIENGLLQFPFSNYNHPNLDF